MLTKGTATISAHQPKLSIGMVLVVHVLHLLSNIPKVRLHENIANIPVKMANFYTQMELALMSANSHSPVLLPTVSYYVIILVPQLSSSIGMDHVLVLAISHSPKESKTQTLGNTAISLVKPHNIFIGTAHAVGPANSLSPLESLTTTFIVILLVPSALISSIGMELVKLIVHSH